MNAPVSFTILGGPKGKERPRFDPRTKRIVTPAQTRLVEARVREAWQQAGRPDLGDGPIAVCIDIAVARPGNHFRVNGDLSKAGLRAHRPMRHPDVDNVQKLICDALNQCAYKDDKQVVDAEQHRRWCDPGEREHVRVTLAQVPPPAAFAQAAA